VMEIILASIVLAAVITSVIAPPVLRFAVRHTAGASHEELARDRRWTVMRPRPVPISANVRSATAVIKKRAAL